MIFPHKRLTRTNALLVVLAAALASSGCTTMVAYSAKPNAPVQTVRYTQGVGTVVEKHPDHEVFMYPTFRTQGTATPTFTIGYANNGAEAVNFTPGNIKAYFRGQPVEIYTYTQRIAEIQGEKQGKQVALAILGGLAAGAAAYGASHQTYQNNYSGIVAGRRGVTTFAGTNTVQVYDPLAGILAGTVVAGATGLGVQQLEFSAQNQERAASALLQENTVDPLQMVAGELMVKNCCDPYPSPNDTLRFEVTANGTVSVFEFQRNKISR